jgi:hypothetical protein
MELCTGNKGEAQTARAKCRIADSDVSLKSQEAETGKPDSTSEDFRTAGCGPARPVVWEGTAVY